MWAVGAPVSVVTLCRELMKYVHKVRRLFFKQIHGYVKYYSVNFGLLLEKRCVLYIAFKIIDPTPRNFESYWKEAKIKNILLNTNTYTIDTYNHCFHGVNQ